jgi:cytochrome P450
MAMLEKHVCHLIDLIPQDGSTVDLQDLFFRMTMDTATEFLFGESTNCLKQSIESQYMNEFVEAFHYAQDIVAMRLALGSLATWLPCPKFRKSIRRVHEFVDQYTARALEYRQMQHGEKRGVFRFDSRYVFLYEMVEHVQDPIKIRSELVSILTAGRDTTASLLSNCSFVLARRPDIWAKLQAEVGKLRGAPPTFDQLRECTYVRNTLNECV